MTRQRSFRRAVVAGVLAAAALGGGVYLGGLRHSDDHHWVVVGLAVAFAVFGVVAARLTATEVDRLSRIRAGPAAASTAALLCSIVGYALVLIGVLQLIDVNLSSLLVGGAITGVVVGIAAQQTLGSFFAGVVLLFARPYIPGRRIRVYSGALGGPFDGVITGAGLLYTTMQTDDGLLHLPNSALLLAAIGPPPLPELDPDGPDDDLPLAGTDLSHGAG